MEKEFGCPFFIDNDMNTAALAEKRFGFGKETKTFIYMTVSTGVGAGIFIDCKLYRGIDGEHPEIGHHAIGEKTTCGCGNSGCLESCISGASIRKIYKKKPEELDDKEWGEIGRKLGTGLRNIINFYAPELIVLGGGVVLGAGKKLFAPAMDELKNHMLIKMPDIRITELGDDICVLGAISLARDGGIR